MKDIKAEEIISTVARLCMEAAVFLGDDVKSAIKKAIRTEQSESGRQVLEMLLENASIAEQEKIPLCQDCGATVIFIEFGQDVNIIGGNLYEALAQGVSKGYAGGYLRKSIVDKPFSERKNTNDNTPPIIHSKIVSGSNLKITVVPKGGGSENMSRFKVLKPSDGRSGIIDFVVETVREAGGNPCPPLIIGVGIGGTAEKSMLIAKEALLRETGKPSDDPANAELERELLKRINALGIGPQGFGGRVTAFAVHVKTFPCHIASLPVAVNIQCHSARHKEAII